MYVILFYDIAGREQKERNNANRIRKAVEKFLPRVQFSVYEGGRTLYLVQADFTDKITISILKNLTRRARLSLVRSCR